MRMVRTGFAVACPVAAFGPAVGLAQGYVEAVAVAEARVAAEDRGGAWRMLALRMQDRTDE